MFKTINGGKLLPTRATKHSAYTDVYANGDYNLKAGSTTIVDLGITIDNEFIRELPQLQKYIYAQNKNDPRHITDEEKYEEFMSTHYLQLAPRSSLRAKGLVSGMGVIDLDFASSIGMVITNPLTSLSLGGEEPFKIHKGDRIGQITLLEHKSNLFNISSDTERTDGFGSTGDK